MKFVPSWLYYSVLRVLMFVIPLAILLSLGLWPWASAVIAALVGLCLSYLLLGKSRESVARELYHARHPDKQTINPDSEIEDSLMNAQEHTKSERESKSQ
ncbi:DUF4229 domain-containing protein [Cryobacterium sp. Y82]|uniref:DUF4229 domain-containing protein n=1 Tax=Cryobacterium sp. Y82 TaxID=2045017 RepID=UPI000CE52EC0|nr:DUF4229 domain-containing protein [Cryobacterium sp. Y82]